MNQTEFDISQSGSNSYQQKSAFLSDQLANPSISNRTISQKMNTLNSYQLKKDGLSQSIKNSPKNNSQSDQASGKRMGADSFIRSVTRETIMRVDSKSNHMSHLYSFKTRRITLNSEELDKMMFKQQVAILDDHYTQYQLDSVKNEIEETVVRP